jgi:hypothetical protein
MIIGKKSKKILLFITVITLSGLSGFLIGNYYNTRNVQANQCPISDADLKASAAYLQFKRIKSSFMPSGIPDIYGQELNISFDKIQDAINKVRVFGPTYGKEGKKIILTGENLERYTNIGLQTSCQYCCRAKTLVRKDGKAACGCAHSIMMRGLAAYLIENHPELSDKQILDELSIWKVAYFPKQSLSTKLQDLEKAGDEGIKEIAREFPDFLPKMVGGC